MRKFLAFLWLSLFGFIGFSFASNTVITDQSYTADGDNITIYRNNVSDGGNVDISVWDSNSGGWIHIGDVDIRDQKFSYMREGKTTQKILLAPDNGGDSVQMDIGVDNENKNKTNNSETITRTVITAVPKTGPSVSLIGIIVATLAIFGGYIYIKKRAAI